MTLLLFTTTSENSTMHENRIEMRSWFNDIFGFYELEIENEEDFPHRLHNSKKCLMP